MPTLTQDGENGKWKITTLYHEYSENVAIPVTLYYPTHGENSVSYTISHTKNTEKQTDWATPVGEEIDTDKISFDSNTVLSADGTKKYKITGITWTQEAYRPPTPEPTYTYDVVLGNTGTTAFACNDGVYSPTDISLTATYNTYADGVLVQSASTNVTNSATWSSNNTSVATVSRGKITPKGQGTANITAKYNGVTSTQFTVSVPQCDAPTPSYTYDVVITKSGDITGCNGTIQLSATYRKKEGSNVIDTTDVTTTATWSSNNTSVATVSKGKVTFNNTGTTQQTVKITATSDGEGGSKENSMSLTIPACSQPEPTYTYDVVLGNTGTTAFTCNDGVYSPTDISLTATYRKKNGSTVVDTTDVTTAATWSSDNTSVATVSGGKITPKSQGTAKITAEYNGVTSGEFTITVPKCEETPKYTYDVVIVNTASTTVFTCTDGVYSPETIKLSAKYRKKLGNEVIEEMDVSDLGYTHWTSLNPMVARVTSSDKLEPSGTKGIVTPVSDGYTIITVHHDATEGTVTDQLRIDVEKCQQSKGRICIKDSTPTGATVKIKADGAITEVYYTGGTQCLNDEYVVGTNVSWTATTEGYTDKTGSITIVKGDNYITFTQQKQTILPTFDVSTGLQSYIVPLHFNFKPNGKLATTGICWEGYFYLKVTVHNDNTGMDETTGFTVYVKSKTVTDELAPNGVSFDKDNITVRTVPSSTNLVGVRVDTSTTSLEDRIVLLVKPVGSGQGLTIKSVEASSRVQPTQTTC